jgi:hypothetical protein
MIKDIEALGDDGKAYLEQMEEYKYTLPSSDDDYDYNNNNLNINSSLSDAIFNSDSKDFNGSGGEEYSGEGYNGNGVDYSGANGEYSGSNGDYSGGNGSDYYGGNGDEKSTTYLKGVFSDCLDSEYKNLVHIDIHSGYGPRYNMVIFNSVYETMTEAETKKAFNYDYVISHDSESFYATTGDTTDFFYRLAESKKTEKEIFSTCFEFGTIGDSFIDSILSLKYTVDENREHWYPTENKTTKEVVSENYWELFYPTETEWREKTIADFKAATEGVLDAKLKY